MTNGTPNETTTTRQAVVDILADTLLRRLLHGKGASPPKPKPPRRSTDPKPSRR